MNINIKVEKCGVVTVKHEIPNAESGKQLYETLISYFHIQKNAQNIFSRKFVSGELLDIQ
jgi:hypothetical protein